MKFVILKTFPKVSDYKIFNLAFHIFSCNNKPIIAILLPNTIKADISQRHIRSHPNN